MESIIMQHTQNDSKKVDQLIKECLDNHVVLRRILEYFSTAELRQASCVNKLWNYEARNVMRNRGNSVALVVIKQPWIKQKRTEDPYDDFKAFGIDLHQMNIPFFSGLHIHLNMRRLLFRRTNFHAEWPTAVLNSSDEATLGAIIEKLTLKSFSMTMLGPYWNWSPAYKNFPGLLLGKRIFQHLSQVLEKISLRIQFEEEASILLEQCRFPRLKILKVYGVLKPSDEFTNFLKILVSRAPNLQEFHSDGQISQISTLLQGTSIVHFHFGEVAAPFDDIPVSAIDPLRLEEMVLEYTGPEFNFDRFNRITPIILRTCCTTTLCSVTVDAVLAVPLMCYGVCLQNLKRLRMKVDYHRLELLEPRILRIIKDFGFTRIFPSLKHVTIDMDHSFDHLSPDHMNAIIEEANATLRETQPYGAPKIEVLCLLNGISDVSAQFFATVFPNVKKLHVGSVRDGDFPFGSIWKYLVDLEQLIISGNITKTTGDMDSAFCGIFPEEVAQLKQKDDEYLRKVHIVPVMPAITCLRNLRSFTFYVSGIELHRSLFSRVTGLITFARCPNLRVKLLYKQDYVYRAMRSIIPYVSAVSGD